MKSLPFVISRKAVSHIQEIWLYTVEKWSVEQADRCYNLIFDEISYICKHINSGNQRGLFEKGIRHRKSNLIFFYKKRNDIVEVIRILHERMDIDNRLND